MGKPTDVSLDEKASQLLERIPEVLQRPEGQDQFRSLAVACHGRMLELSELDRTAAIAHALAGARLLSSLQRHCQPQPDWVELHEEQCCRYGAIWIHEELTRTDSVRAIVWSMQALALLDRLDQIHQPPPTWTETLRHAFHQQLAPTTVQSRADQEDKPSLSHHLRSPQVLESAELPFPSRLLMVLGMHRSGTSAVAGYLCRHGFLAPTDALPADLKNPTGYWEPQAIVSLHEQLLGDSQTSWDDTWLPPEVIKQAITNTNLSHIYEALSRSFPFNTGSSDVALVKDPRLCRWLPLWNRFTEDNNIECAVLIVHRHPLAVLKSLARRDQLPADRILLLWLQHTLEAEFHSRRFKRRIISYEEFLKNPETLMVQAKGFWPHLEIGNHHPSSAGDSTVKQELNHAAEPFNDSAHPANEKLMQLALEVHSILGAGGHPDYQQLDRARQTLQNHLHTVTQQLGRMATLQLFWEPIHGSGFSEDHSIRRSIAISRQSAEVRFHLPFYAEGIRRLRLDPAEYPCLVHIEHSSLHSEHNEVLWQWPEESNPEAPLIRQPFSSINEDTVLLGKDRLGTTRISIFSRSHDPALLVDIPETILAKASGPCSFIIKARWEPLSAEMCDIFTQIDNTD